MAKNLKAVPSKAPTDLPQTNGDQPKAGPMDAIPLHIRRGVLEKQLENYHAQAVEHFGAYEVNKVLYPGNAKAAKQSFELMNLALAAAERAKQLIAELPVEAEVKQ